MPRQQGIAIMTAAVDEGPRTVAVKDAPDAKIEHPCDIIVKITTTNICGSDLHMYEGRTSFESGRTLGHENMGQVVEIGPAVRRSRSASTWSCSSTSPAASASSASGG
ncbi:hypothetical protein IQ61_36425 [Streptomyces scabiei]|nr:hypothetical protein IQ61_36425 [Streptomyces scabiei]